MTFAMTAAFAASIAVANPAKSAEIRQAQSSQCVIEITGELVGGDYDRFASLAAAMFPDEVLESTANNTVCLDSPGGNLAEGVKFARHFYKEGVGTVVGDGAECHSACAIMFMMGTAQGPEVSFVNRKLHARGVVGFHRPYLNVPQGEQVDLGLMAFAYDHAFQAALDLISIANSRSPWSSRPMMTSDLMQAMLSHVGNDMYLVDTIDKASRFEVELIGINPSPTFNEETAYYACHNVLQWQHGLTENDITYTPQRAEPYAGYRTVTSISARPGMRAFQVLAQNDGYAMHRCVVTEAGGQFSACGVDEYSNVQVGGGLCGPGDFEAKLTSIPVLALYNPRTPITAVANPSTGVPPAVASSPRCFVRVDGAIEDDEPCQLDQGRSPEGWNIANFVWPSGGRTVIVFKPSGTEINGTVTSPIAGGDLGVCFPNSRTQREFCVRFPN